VSPRGDGVWLETGWGISGVVDMMKIFGDRVPEDLHVKLELLLRREVTLIVTVWTDSRPWDVRSRAA
jgi:hypothetical protein